MATPRLLTVAEVSERTGIAESTYRWWQHVQHTGPVFTKIGRRLYIAEDQLNAWLAGHLKAGQ
jgi:hypothetical protein